MGFLLVVFNSCGTTGNNDSSENDLGPSEKTEQDGSSAEMPTERSVEEIIEHWINGLDERLSLDSEAKKEIRNAYIQAYLATGGKLEDKIDRDQARELRQRIAKDTESEVLNLMSEDQRQFYIRYLEIER